MNDEFSMILNSPFTKEDWAKITDVNMEHTKAVTFQTEGGKKVEFIKVVRCKDCKYSKPIPCKHSVLCTYGEPYESYSQDPDWFCAYGERKEE